MNTMLTKFEEEDEPTLVSVSRYIETEEPTSEVVLGKSDAVYEAHERLRAGNTEAAGFWLLMASSAEENG